MDVRTRQLLAFIQSLLSCDREGCVFFSELAHTVSDFFNFVGHTCAMKTTSNLGQKEECRPGAESVQEVTAEQVDSVQKSHPALCLICSNLVKLEICTVQPAEQYNGDLIICRDGVGTDYCLLLYIPLKR